MAETDTPMHESFDNGVGALSHAWNVDLSVPGEATLSGSSALMEPAVGRDAGHGYGTYTVVAKLEGSVPGPGIILWPGDNAWPGQEIDMAEIAQDGSGRQYGTLHWDEGGSDGFEYLIYDGVEGGVFHEYQMVWEPGRITFLVDGVEQGTITRNVPEDFDAGGTNNTIGFLNIGPDTSITVREVDYVPLGAGTPVLSSDGDGTGTSDSDGNRMTDDDGTGMAAAQVQDEAGAGGTASVEDTASVEGALDWAAIGARAEAVYEQTGQWPVLDEVLAQTRGEGDGWIG